MAKSKEHSSLKIILIRPGSTEFDQQGRILGTLDVPLSEVGDSEVDNTIDQLRPFAMDAIYTCPSESSMQTAERVAETLRIKCKSLEQLHNLDCGLWQGLTIEEVRRKQPKVFRKWQDHPKTVCPPQGEMLAAAEERVRQSLGKIIKKHKKGTVGIVVPEPVASLVGSILRQSDVCDLFRTGDERVFWEVIDIEPAVLTGAN